MDFSFHTLKGKIIPYLSQIVSGLAFVIVYFLVHRNWNCLGLLLLCAAGIFTVVFTSGLNRILLVSLIYLLGIVERHFILHYSTILSKIGLQALITLKITDSDEVLSYITSLFFVEYFLIFSALLLLLFLIWKRKEPVWKRSIWGLALAYMLSAACLASNIAPPVLAYLKDRESLGDYYTARANHCFHAVSTRPQQKEVAILVIGESHRYDEMERLFQRDELPALCKARKEGNLLVFSDMITNYPQTYFSVFTLLSRRTADSTNPYWPEHGLLTLFREAGWNVVFLTYQNMNLLEYGYDAVVNEGQSYINHRHTSGTKLDTGMLPILQDALKENKGKLLVVIKMTGCHFHFASPHRYPDTSRKYLPDGRYEKSNPMSGKPEDIEKMKNAYRNAILFSGLFIDSILECVQKESAPAMMFFLSDHGIINYDDGKNPYFGKARSNYHIPAFLYLNDAYRTQLLAEEHWENLKKHQAEPMTNSCVFETLETLSGIDDPAKRKNLDLTSPEFQPQPQRTVWLWDEQISYESLPAESP